MVAMRLLTRVFLFGQTHWSPAVPLGGECLQGRGPSLKWERSLEFIGLVMEPGSYGGGGVIRHRENQGPGRVHQVDALIMQPRSLLVTARCRVQSKCPHQCYMGEWLLAPLFLTRGRCPLVMERTSVGSDGWVPPPPK